MAKVLDLDEIKSRRFIIVQATDAQLSEIKGLLCLGEGTGRIKKLNDNIYSLCPKMVDVDLPKVLKRITFGDLKSNDVKTEKNSDFENSATFYQKSKQKAGFRIVSDDFSDSRNIKLYEGFMAIEKKWREIILTKTDSLQINIAKTPQNYRSKVGDHKLSQYSLSELFEVILFSPASDKYISSRWESDKEKDSNTVISLTKLKMIDELNFSLTSDQLSYLQKQRNVCMHFRVVPVSDYSKTVGYINKYLKDEELKEFAKGFQGINTMYFAELSKSISQMVSSLVPVTTSLSNFVNSQIWPKYDLGNILPPDLFKK